MLKDQKILITGPTGQVALPVTRALAKNNEVWGVARFHDPATKADMEAAGVTCVTADLATSDFTELPDDFAFVLNMAVARSDDFDRDLAANAESVGMLMSRCRKARAFLQWSSTAVYQPNGHHAFAETDPLGDNHRVVLPTYSICKIAAEVVARTGARLFNLPTTIARLNVPYGSNGGWPAYCLELMLADEPVPIHSDGPCLYNPIHETDILEQIPRMLAIASVPATIVNWGGEAVSVEEWCTYLGQLVGIEPSFSRSDTALESVTIDLTQMHLLIGSATVDWREGLRSMVAAHHPELLGATSGSSESSLALDFERDSSS